MAVKRFEGVPVGEEFVTPEGPWNRLVGQFNMVQMVRWDGSAAVASLVAWVLGPAWRVMVAEDGGLLAGRRSLDPWESDIGARFEDGDVVLLFTSADGAETAPVAVRSDYVPAVFSTIHAG